MSLTPRWMRAEDEPDVRALAQVAHPTWTPRIDHWFHAFPTLVLCSPANRLLGYTQLGFVHHGEHGLMALGVDLAVVPDARGCGLGTALHAERLRIATLLEAGSFTGMTEPGNAAMIAIFRNSGMTPTKEIPNAFPNVSDGVAWFTLLKKEN